MDVEKVLEGIGLSSGERKVYLALLKLGSVAVSEIKEETGLHRTTIYDFLEKLINKGLVNYVIKNSVKSFDAVHPNRLLEFIKDKEDSLKEVMPQLEKLIKFEKEAIVVETYRGIEGMKVWLNEIIKVGKDFVGFGVDESMFEEKFGALMDQYFVKEKELGIKERMLTAEGAPFVYDSPTITYRSIPKEYFNPTPTVIYGDNVGMLIWEPMTVIIIRNKELADGYLKHFELLWKGAKKVKKR